MSSGLVDKINLLSLNETCDDTPSKNHLVQQFSENAEIICKHIKNFKEAWMELCFQQDGLCDAYRKLSDVTKELSNQVCPLHANDYDFKQSGLQVASFLDELSALHKRSAHDLRDSIASTSIKLPSQPINQLMNFSNPRERQSLVERNRKEKDQVLHQYMKLPLRCTPEAHDELIWSLASRQRQLNKTMVVHQAQLNAVYLERELIPLSAFTGLFKSFQQQTKNASTLCIQLSLNNFIDTITNQLDNTIELANEATNNFADIIKSIEENSPLAYAPEPPFQQGVPQLPLPNLSLTRKSGYLLYRDRGIIRSEWIEVHCYIFNGDLMFQRRSEIAAKAVVNLNGVNVSVGRIECDDRRNTFQILSDERKPIVLQALNATQCDEWVSTIANNIHGTERSAIKYTQSNKDLEDIHLQMALTMSTTSPEGFGFSDTPDIHRTFSLRENSEKFPISEFEQSPGRHFTLDYRGGIQLIHLPNTKAHLENSATYIIGQSASSQRCECFIARHAIWFLEVIPKTEKSNIPIYARISLPQIFLCSQYSDNRRLLILVIDPPHGNIGLPDWDSQACLLFDTNEASKVSEEILASQIAYVTSIAEECDPSEAMKITESISRSSEMITRSVDANIDLKKLAGLSTD